MIDVLIERFKNVRRYSETFCEPLAIEDYSVQPTLDVSPPKWHLAHITWFWEQFILVPYCKGYRVFREAFAYFFNSYYNNAGERVLRPNRGLMTRPTVEEVWAYRQYVTNQMVAFLETNPPQNVLDVVEIGINHEEQHQELLAYDIKYILGHQPTFAPFKTDLALSPEIQPRAYIAFEEGIYEVGYEGNGFCFDNELGRHKTYIQSFEIANTYITNREYLEFIQDGGYKNFNLWHAEGWNWVNEHQIVAPLYWYQKNDAWFYYDYSGLVEVNLSLPVMHLSYFEAYAFAEWQGKRLPTEFEWEIAADALNWGQLWEWTASAYLPYPRFHKAEGALGEYNGKFMVNQQVLRGASIATPQGHERKTYRNFFSTHLRWMFSGLRLAQ